MTSNDNMNVIKTFVDFLLHFVLFIKNTTNCIYNFISRHVTLADKRFELNPIKPGIYSCYQATGIKYIWHWIQLASIYKINVHKNEINARADKIIVMIMILNKKILNYTIYLFICD